jgi:hypothetical protein
LFLATVLLLMQLSTWRYWFKFPKGYLLGCTVCAWFLCFAFQFPIYYGGVEEYGCQSPTSGRTGDDGFCTFQAVIIYFCSWDQVSPSFLLRLTVLLTSPRSN